MRVAHQIKIHHNSLPAYTANSRRKLPKTNLDSHINDEIKSPKHWGQSNPVVWFMKPFYAGPNRRGDAGRWQVFQWGGSGEQSGTDLGTNGTMNRPHMTTHIMVIMPPRPTIQHHQFLSTEWRQVVHVSEDSAIHLVYIASTNLIFFRKDIWFLSSNFPVTCMYQLIFIYCSYKKSMITTLSLSLSVTTVEHLTIFHAFNDPLASRGSNDHKLIT